MTVQKPGIDTGHDINLAELDLKDHVHIGIRETGKHLKNKREELARSRDYTARIQKLLDEGMVGEGNMSGINLIVDQKVLDSMTEIPDFTEDEWNLMNLTMESAVKSGKFDRPNNSPLTLREQWHQLTVTGNIYDSYRLIIQSGKASDLWKRYLETKSGQHMFKSMAARNLRAVEEHQQTIVTELTQIANALGVNELVQITRPSN